MPEASDEARGFQGRAISVAVHEFQGPLGDLSFREQVGALREALTAAGYALESHDGLTAEEMGSKVHGFLESPGDHPRIVHILSHGVAPPPSRRLHAVGACGQFHKDTDVQVWLDLVDIYHPERPYTLFLLDLCGAGQAAWPDWTQGAVGFDRRAWVIGACEESEAAYNARLTQALADTLNGLRAEPASLELEVSRPYVPFDKFVDATRARVDELASAPGAHQQRVTATPYDGTYPDLPFLRNPRAVPVAVQLDEILDFDHWQRASTGRLMARPHRRGVGFVGRSTELGRIADWLDSTLEGEAHLPWLCLVTGRRGSGKSALLGVLVCATHEDFDKADDAIWLTAFRGDAPSRHDTGHMAAVHARRRSLDAILTSVARQLRVQESRRKWLDESSPARSLCEAIRDLPFPPLLVMDAVDEAESPAEVITELVQPLAERRPDGRPLAYCLVGIRDEEPAHELRATAQQSGLHFNLETIDADTLYTDLREYVLMLLRTEPRYGGVRFKDARPLLAKGVAVSLSGREGPNRGGEFLISGLYTHHILSREWPAFDVKSAEDLGRAVPLDLADVLKMDLVSGPVQRPMRRPLFTALAHAHGAGMPASVARSVAKLFLTDPVLPELDAVQQALDGEGHYLRVSLDTDGTLLYRLYNQGLDEHLRPGAGSTGGEGRAEGVLDAVLAWAQGLPSALHSIWSTPYVRRHAAQHAADEGRLPELLADPGFLIHTDTDVLGPMLGPLLPRPTEPHAFLLRLPPARLRDLPFGARRQLFGLEAMRWGAPALSHDLLTTPAHGAPPVRAVPLWSTGTNLDARQLYVTADHTDAVNAVVVLDLDGRQVTISAGADGTIRTADLDDGRPVGEPITGHTSEITALAATTLDGHDGPVLITGSANGPVHLWDLASSGPVGDPLMGHTDEVTAVTTWTAAGKSFLITGSVDGTVRVWQLPGGEPVGDPLMGHTDSVTALAVHMTSEQSFLITGSVDGTVRVWQLPGGEPVGDPLMGHTDEVTAVTTWTAAGKSFLITGSVDGTVRVWQLPGGEPVGDPLMGHTDSVTTITVLPSTAGTTVFTGDASGRIYQWSVEASPVEGTVLRGHTGAVTALSLGGAEEPSVLVSASEDGTLRGWALSDGSSMPTPALGHEGRVLGLGSLTTSRGQDTAVSVGTDRVIRFWRTDDGGPAENLPPIALPAGPAAMAYSAEERLLVIGTSTGTVLLHSTDDGALTHVPTELSAAVTAVECATFGGRPHALIAHQDGRAHLWDLRERKGVARLTGHRSAITAISFFGPAPSPTAVTGSYDRTVRLWDLTTHTECGQLATHPDAVMAVACTTLDTVPVAVTACADGSLRLWELEECRQIDELDAHSDAVTSLAFATVDGVPTAVTTCRDGTARLWNLTTRRQSEELVFPYPVHRALWLPGDRLLVGYGADVAVFHAGGLHDDD